MAMPALLNKLATENLVPEASRIIDCFATIMPYLRVGEGMQRLYLELSSPEISSRAWRQPESGQPFRKITP